MKTKLTIVFVLLTSVLLTSCTQPDKATEILVREGYQNIQIEGYAFFGCGEDDTFKTRFSAEKNDQPVTGVVCAGLGKGSTIRFD